MEKKFGSLGGRVRDEGKYAASFMLLGDEFKGNLKRFAEASLAFSYGQLLMSHRFPETRHRRQTFTTRLTAFMEVLFGSKIILAQTILQGRPYLASHKLILCKVRGFNR